MLIATTGIRSSIKNNGRRSPYQKNKMSENIITQKRSHHASLQNKIPVFVLAANAEQNIIRPTKPCNNRKSIRSSPRHEKNTPCLDVRHLAVSSFSLGCCFFVSVFSFFLSDADFGVAGGGTPTSLFFGVGDAAGTILTHFPIFLSARADGERQPHPAHSGGQGWGEGGGGATRIEPLAQGGSQCVLFRCARFVRKRRLATP